MRKLNPARPSNYRDFPGRRWVGVALRVLHLVGLAGFSAALLSGETATARGDLFAVVLAASGFGMLALDWWASRDYPLQLSGAAMFFKLALVTAFVLDSAHRVAIFWIVLVLSAVVSHAPARFRHRTLVRTEADRKPSRTR